KAGETNKAPRSRKFPVRFSKSGADMRPPSRGAMRPKLCKNVSPLKAEGAGKAGCPLHPQPRVQCVGSTRVSSPQVTGTPGLPCAMVLTAYFALSPVIGLFVTVIARIWLAGTRSGRLHLRET